MDSQSSLQFDVEYPDHLSRLLIFVKWLLIIPHAFVLSILYFALLVTTFVAWWAILFTGQYPRGLFDFAVMVLRWSARVQVYSNLLRDEYPPFGDSYHPVRLELEYPTRLSRILIFVKWLLVIPHQIVLSVLGFAAGIISIVIWFAILILGHCPRGMFDFIIGYHRWNYRVSAYVLLLTDAYPPFTLSGSTMPMIAPPGTEIAPRF